MQNTCPIHRLQIEYVCFHIAKKRTDQKCINRLLCNECNSQNSHDVNHAQFIFKLEDFVKNDFSLVFFQLFFTIPQIQTLFVPLKINSENILRQLQDITLKCQPKENNSEYKLHSNSFKQQNIMQDEDSQKKFNLQIENYHNKILVLSERINTTIDKIQTFYRNCFEWDSVLDLVNLYLEEKISSDKTNDLLNKTLKWIQCTQIYLKNIYIVDENLNFSIQNQKTFKQFEIIAFYKFAQKELFLNLNHIRSLFLMCQPFQLSSMENQVRLSMITYFPLNTKKITPTVSMNPFINLKQQNNQILLIKDYECLILQLIPYSHIKKLQNIIYSQKKIVDASISLFDFNQIVILQEDKLIEVYQINPSSSALNYQRLYQLQLDNIEYQILGIDYVIPEEMSSDYQIDELDDDDFLDYVAIKTQDSIILVDSLEWKLNSQFQISNSFVKVIIQNNCDEIQENSQISMQVEKPTNNDMSLCFYGDQQIDNQHLAHFDMLEGKQIKNFAISSTLKHFAYVIENDLVITDQNKEFLINLPILVKQQILCIDFTIDSTYLFILYENGLIQFYYTFDNYELEYETHALKKVTNIKKAVFTKYLNQIYLITTNGELYNIDLSSHKNFF